MFSYKVIAITPSQRVQSRRSTATLIPAELVREGSHHSQNPTSSWLMISWVPNLHAAGILVENTVTRTMQPDGLIIAHQS